jgi:hypothetical protein
MPILPVGLWLAVGARPGSLRQSLPRLPIRASVTCPTPLCQPCAPLTPRAAASLGRLWRAPLLAPPFKYWPHQPVQSFARRGCPPPALQRLQQPLLPSGRLCPRHCQQSVPALPCHCQADTPAVILSLCSSGCAGWGISVSIALILLPCAYPQRAYRDAARSTSTRPPPYRCITVLAACESIAYCRSWCGLSVPRRTPCTTKVAIERAPVRSRACPSIQRLEPSSSAGAIP